MCSVFLRSTYVYLLFILSGIYILCKRGLVGRLYEFFSYSKKIYPPFGLRVVGKKKKKSDWWWWWWGQNIFLLNQSVRFLTHNIQSVAVRRTGRTCFIFGRKSARRFPEIFPFFLLQRISLVLFTEKRWTIGIVVCFVFITVDDLLKSVGFFAFRDTTQEFTAKHSRYTLLFFKNRR